VTTLTNNTTLKEAQTIVVRADGSGTRTQLAELWRYRDLLTCLAMRDVKVRYKQTLLGVAWVVVQPLAMMAVYTAFVGWWMGMSDKTGDVPYPIFVFAGLLPWTFFSTAAQAATSSLVTNGAMLRKIYFPRLIVPLASMGAPLVDFLVSLAVLFMVALAWRPTLVISGLWALPLSVFGMALATTGVGVTLASLTVRYRDFRHICGFLLQVWFYLTPVIYPVSIVPKAVRWLLQFNPMSGPIDAMRAAVTGVPIDVAGLAISAGVSTVLLIVGVKNFSRGERDMADLI
jgi:lipopolysaccharide transport system permease protein